MPSRNTVLTNRGIACLTLLSQIHEGFDAADQGLEKELLANGFLMAVAVEPAEPSSQEASYTDFSNSDAFDRHNKDSVETDEAIVAPAVSQSDEASLLEVPEHAREWELLSLNLSVRSTNVLYRDMGLRTLGQLNGVREADLLARKNFGIKSLYEMRELMAGVKNGAIKVVASNLDSPNAMIPAWASEWRLDQLPLDRRSESVLVEKYGFLKLGELQGLSFEALKNNKNVGNTTVAYLRQMLDEIEKGMFGVGTAETFFSGGSPYEDALAFCHSSLQNALTDLDEETRTIVGLRLGYNASMCSTLDTIAKKVGKTRERIRQIMEEQVKILRRRGGPKLFAALNTLQKQHEAGFNPLRLDDAFLMNLLHYLNPRIPVWCDIPGGHSSREERGGATDLSAACERATRNLLDIQISPIPMQAACQHSVSSLGADRITVAEFYRILYANPSFHIIDEGETIMIAKRAHRLVDVCVRVLQASETPLTGDKILKDVREQFPHLSDKWKTEPRGVAALVDNHEDDEDIAPANRLYRFGEGTIGLIKHLSVSQELQEQLRDRFRDYLEQQGIPVSCGEFYRNHLPDEVKRQVSRAAFIVVIESDPKQHFKQMARKSVVGLNLDTAPWIHDRVPEIADIILSLLERCDRPLQEGKIDEHVNTIRKTDGTKTALEQLVAKGLVVSSSKGYLLADS